MTPINPSSAESMALKAKYLYKNLANKNKAPILSPQGSSIEQIIDELNSPLKRAIREGRSKDEIQEIAMRECAGIATMEMLDEIAKDSLAKLAAKNGYKPL